MSSMKITGFVLLSGTMLSGFFGSAVVAADIDSGCVPAVSGVTGKLEASGGYSDSDSTTKEGRFLGTGTLSMPIGCLLGLQLDVGGGTFGKADYGGIGGHLFIRDPSSYLLGVHAQYIDFDGNDVARIDGEFELYADQFTLSGVLGYEHIENFNTDNLLGVVEASYYINDDFKVSGGFRHFFDTDVGALGMEFQPSELPASVFVDTMFGSDDYVSVVGGLRFYLGGEHKSLKARHREDDPGHMLNLVNELRSAPAPTGTGTPPPTGTFVPSTLG